MAAAIGEFALEMLFTQQYRKQRQRRFVKNPPPLNGFSRDRSGRLEILPCRHIVQRRADVACACSRSHSVAKSTVRTT